MPSRLITPGYSSKYSAKFISFVAVILRCLYEKLKSAKRPSPRKARFELISASPHVYLSSQVRLVRLISWHPHCSRPIVYIIVARFPSQIPRHLSLTCTRCPSVLPSPVNLFAPLHPVAPVFHFVAINNIYAPNPYLQGRKECGILRNTLRTRIN